MLRWGVPGPCIGGFFLTRHALQRMAERQIRWSALCATLYHPSAIHVSRRSAGYRLYLGPTLVAVVARRSVVTVYPRPPRAASAVLRTASWASSPF